MENTPAPHLGQQCYLKIWVYKDSKAFSFKSRFSAPSLSRAFPVGPILSLAHIVPEFREATLRTATGFWDEAGHCQSCSLPAAWSPPKHGSLRMRKAVVLGTFGDKPVKGLNNKEAKMKHRQLGDTES